VKEALAIERRSVHGDLRSVVKHGLVAVLQLLLPAVVLQNVDDANKQVAQLALFVVGNKTPVAEIVSRGGFVLGFLIHALKDNRVAAV